MKKLDNLIFRLQHIARRNDDVFKYQIDISAAYEFLHYSFKAIETADKHVFLEGHGETLDEALDSADKEIDEACKYWGYKP